MNKLFEILWIRSMKGVGKVRFNRVYADLLKRISTCEECEALIEKCEPTATKDDINEAKKKAEVAITTLSNFSDITAVTLYDDEYPRKLMDLKEKKPPIIYVKGSLDYLLLPSMAVVGTRKPSQWTTLVEDRFIHKVIELKDLVIISGLALGCDSLAHEAALAINGKTIAVLPSGVNVITPATNKKLATSIVASGGCLVSEYFPTEIANKSTYVERDSIIAALSGSTYVMECAEKSGTMHTVNAAYKIGRNIACYYIEDTAKGDYSGNLHAMKSMGAQKVANTEELEGFLNFYNCVTNNEQLTIFETQI